MTSSSDKRSKKTNMKKQNETNRIKEGKRAEGLTEDAETVIS